VPWAVRVRVVFGGTTAVLSGSLMFMVTISAVTDRSSSFFVRIFSVLLAAMFAMLWIGNIRARRRSVRLLAHGRVGFATLAAKTELPSSHNDKVYALTFSFDDRGVERTIEVRTTRPKPLTDDRSEQIVYLAEEPNKAELVDSLPGQPRVSVDGTIGAEGHLVPALAALALFCLAVLVCVAGVFAWLI
jgi:hypothetical protein